MLAALFISQAGLLSWLAFQLEPYHRPAFCLLILTMLSASGAYHLPRPAKEFQASASAQSLAMLLAVGEGVCKVAGRKKLLAGLYCAAFGGLFVVAEQGLDQRFGWFVTAYTITLTFQLGAAIGAMTLFWDRHLAWLTALAVVKPAAALSYWFLSDYATWKAINDSVMLETAILMVAWILAVPVSAAV